MHSYDPSMTPIVIIFMKTSKQTENDYYRVGAQDGNVYLHSTLVSTQYLLAGLLSLASTPTTFKHTHSLTHFPLTLLQRCILPINVSYATRMYVDVVPMEIIPYVFLYNAIAFS